MANHYKNIGNPVDMWWNITRAEITLCIDLLAQFPPAPNATVVADSIASVGRAYHYVKDAPYPEQAQQARAFLLESLLYLHHALKEQQISGKSSHTVSYNIAKHKFSMVSFTLLKRGIYEPSPSKQSQVA